MLAWICVTVASMRVILFESVACEVSNEAVVDENVRIVSMRARKSLVVRVMYCGGVPEVLGPAISDRAVGMGPEGFGGVEGIGTCGIDAEAEETGGGTGEAGAEGSRVCSAIGDRSSHGLSSAGSSSYDPGRGRRKARGLARHRSIVREASQPRRCSNRGSAGNLICPRI